MDRPHADPHGFEAGPAILVGRPRPSRVTLVLRWLVATLVGLNLLVLAALVAVTMFDGGDETASTATETSDPAADDAADPAPDAPVIDDPAADVAADDAAADDGSADPGTGDDADPVDEQPVVSTEPPPIPAPWEPTINEVQAEAKRIGGYTAHLITNYDADSTLADVVATLPPGADQLAGLMGEVDVVHHPGMWSRGTVEYVQLGGHRNGRISNIVVIRQDIGLDGSSEIERTETRVMEVRLARDADGEWELETIASSGGVPAERPADLSATAAAVVDHDRIELPDTAAWDIYNGLINRQTLEVMLDIAERTPYSVVVLQTGHSYNVFGTDRVSNHSVGRAVDIYKLDSALVVDSHATWSEFYELSEWIVSRSDIREFGSPWRFPDAVAHTFTDEVHHDHLHIGVNPYPSEPWPSGE